MEAPQYVSAGGVSLTSNAQVGMLGLFPGTPDYDLPAPTVPTPGTTPPAAESAAVELKVHVPGVLSAQGSLAIAPALSSLVVPTLLALARELLLPRVEDGPSQTEGKPAGAPSAKCPNPARERPETEARVWDRD
jgi:hypothetical protein